MIRNDSKWGPWLKSCKSAEDQENILQAAQNEWDRLHIKRGGIQVTIINLSGCYQL